MPFSNVQMELLKLYATDLSERDMNDLRDTLARFYAEKSINLADEVWEKKGMTNDDMDHWLNDSKT